MKRILCLLFFIHTLYADEPYTLGHGYKLGDTPLYLGGYSSLTYDLNHRESEVAFDNVALLLYGSLNAFTFLSEGEASDIVLQKEGKGDIDLSHKSFHLERLFINTMLGDNSSITVGKFNTDMGFWNQTPINILQDTTTPPHAMLELFPTLSSGIGIHHALNDTLSLSLSLQHNKDLEGIDNNILVNTHYSLWLKGHEETYSWGLGGGYFEEVTRRFSSTYATIGFEKEYQFWHLLGEFYTRDAKQGVDIPYDVYIQGTYHLSAKQVLVLRTESYNKSTIDTHNNTVLFGYTYRPYPSMALKGEYEKHRIDERSHGVFSFSVLF